MEESKQEKLVSIEPLPEKPRVTKPAGRKKIPEEEKIKKRISKGQNPMKDIVNPTPARKRAMEKARMTRDLKREYRRTDDEQRKYDLAIQINALTPNKVEVPSKMNGDLKAKLKRQNPTYGEEGVEPSLLEQNPTLRNVDQPEYADKMLQWSNGSQELWSGKISELETKMNNLDNYLSKIRVLSGEGTAGDYGNPANVKQNHYIIPHTQKITPHQGPTDPSPFHSSLMFRNSVMKKKS
jgi:hypothetical protein